jgi:hypothetical protein
MSVQMVRDLRALVTERGPGVYLVTVSAQGGPHTVYTTARWEGGAIVAEAGTTTAANAAARPLVSLLFPVRADGDYSLIVDGLATLDAVEPGARLRVSPTKAVLHRQGPSPDPTSSCGADCVPLPLLTMPAPR